MISVDELAATPNALAPHYSRFRVAERLLLTGHSHQAWPDRGFEGQQRAWLDAAEYVDDKWERAFAKADRVRRGFARLLHGDETVATGGDATRVSATRGDAALEATARSIALAANTHELVVRFLSALPLRDRPRLVTTDGEFHTIRRQLDRLAEEGIEVVKVAAAPADDVAERLAAAADDRTAAILVSSVFFRDARIVPGLDRVMEACNHAGAELLVDAYHHLNVVPFSIRAMGLDDAFIVGGGYKYCQLGEGNAFMRVPEGRGPRPVVTGWFSEFGVLAEPVGDGGGAVGAAAGDAGGSGGTGDSGDPGGRGARAADAAQPGGPTSPPPRRGASRGTTRVAYGSGADRFAGATYDPTSHYRAADVFDFFDALRLTPALLREVSQHQVRLLARDFDALDLDPALIDRDRDLDLGDVAGFLALRSPHAATLQRMLRERGVHTDHRGDMLRLGPAPYLSDAQLVEAMGVLGECARAVAG